MTTMIISNFIIQRKWYYAHLIKLINHTGWNLNIPYLNNRYLQPSCIQPVFHRSNIRFLRFSAIPTQIIRKNLLESVVNANNASAIHKLRKFGGIIFGCS